MSEQQKAPGEASGAPERGEQASRYVPETHIDAERISATNVVSGIQNITNNYLQGQQYIPPLQLPRRAEHFQDRERERAWLLAHLRPGQVITLCGPGGMGKTALVAEVLWSLAPDEHLPAAFPARHTSFIAFMDSPRSRSRWNSLCARFGEEPSADACPGGTTGTQRASSLLLVLDGAEEADQSRSDTGVSAEGARS